MPSSYTSLLGLVLPVTGELSGTWGTAVNAQLTQLIEDSIANYATASVAGGNWTLTTTSSGAANEARMMILVPTGAPGVSRDIYAPKLSKMYIVVNRSDAVVVLRGGPGTPTTGMTIPAGVTQGCVWDPSAADFRPVGTPLTSRTGSTVLAAGTTAQRDSTPQFGWLRANSSTGLQEWYTGTAWASVRSDTTRVDVASAATVDLTAAGPVSTRDIRITGTTAITAVTVGVGQDYFVTFSGALTLTNNAAIVTNTGADITTAAGDTCVWRATAANTIEVLCYSRASGSTIPDASTTVKGKVELATDAETQTGTDTARAIVPAALAATMLGGVGQAWVDVTASRSASTTYTNSTGRPIMVNVNTALGANERLRVTVAGVAIADSHVSVTGGAKAYVSFIVPNGATYIVELPAGTFEIWSELR